MSLDRRSSLRIERRLRSAHLRGEELRPAVLTAGPGMPTPSRRRSTLSNLRQLGWIRDVSVGGAFLEAPGPVPLRPGELLALRLYLPYPEVEPLSALAEVVRFGRQGSGVGLAFIHLPDRTEGWLRFLADAEVFDAYRRLLL